VTGVHSRFTQAQSAGDTFEYATSPDFESVHGISRQRPNAQVHKLDGLSTCATVPFIAVVHRGRSENRTALIATAYSIG
jgi:hypothetical protein